MRQLLRACLAILIVAAAAPAQAKPYEDEHTCDAMATMISVEMKNLYGIYMEKQTPGTGKAQNLKDLTDTYLTLGCSPTDLKEKIDSALSQWRRHG